MNTKHTPGLWLLTADHGAHIVVDSAGNEIHVGTNEANARLISAAPELLEELRISIEREYNPFEPDNQIARYKRMTALYAKATGQ